jgi:hypothetical protein
VSKIFAAIRFVDAYGTKNPYHVSMTPGKLKAHRYFGQGNNFQGSFKLLAAQHEQKSAVLFSHIYLKVTTLSRLFLSVCKPDFLVA